MDRKQTLLDILKSHAGPVTGSRLAELLAVSRQTVVQDIAFLRKDGFQILSTIDGYMLREQPKPRYEEVIGITHTLEQLKRELDLIVAHHVIIKDVFIEHPVYGRIRSELNIKTPRDVVEFVEKRMASPLPLFSEVSGGLHYHTLVAEDAAMIAQVKSSLVQEGFHLIK
jgi:transcriptional regulator of NAD metabolism